MKESVAARDKLAKFMERLDTHDAAVKVFLGYLEFGISFLSHSKLFNIQGSTPG